MYNDIWLNKTKHLPEVWKNIKIIALLKEKKKKLIQKGILQTHIPNLMLY